jgi:hypothetical protein
MVEEANYSTTFSRKSGKDYAVTTPIFSYTARGRSQLEKLQFLKDSHAAVVFLSNIVIHSSVLVIGNCDLSDMPRVCTYGSLDEFRANPTITGYHVASNIPLSCSCDTSTVVVSDLATFLGDNDILPSTGLFRVIERRRGVFFCNILDYPRYFGHCAVYGDQAYFVSADIPVDLNRYAVEYEKETLTEVLFDQGVSFASLGDNHVDDEIAASYGQQFWNYPDECVAFVR